LVFGKCALDVVPRHYVINEELFGQLKKPVKRLGGTFSPVPYSKPLESAFAPNADVILAAINELVN
jgi:pyruvate dehydrogenase E1 component beta subunit